MWHSGRVRLGGNLAAALALGSVLAQLACVVGVDLGGRACDAAHPCVDGFSCVDGRCRDDGAPPADAGTADAGAFDGGQGDQDAGVGDDDAGPGQPDAGPSVFTPEQLPPGGFVFGAAMGGDFATRLYVVAVPGRMYRSDDRGGSFSACADDLPLDSPIEVDPADGDHVLAAGDDTLLESFDGCATFAATATGAEIGALLVLSDGTLLVGTEFGVLRRDGASAAAMLEPWPTPLDGYWISSMAASADDLNMLIASDGNGMVRTSNGGTAWALANAGLSQGAIGGGVHAIAIDPTNPQRAFANTDDGVFVSGDGGASWASRWYEGRGVIAVDPFEPAFVLANGYDGPTSTWDDFINTYADVRTANMRMAAVHALLFDPDADGRIYAATARGFFVAESRDLSWAEADVGLRAWRIEAIAANDEGVWLATPSGIMHRAAGTTWFWARGDSYMQESYLDDLVLDDANGALFAVGRAVYRSLDGGETLEKRAVPDQTDQWWCYALAIQGSRVVAGTRGGRLMVSTDGGDTFGTSTWQASDRMVDLAFVADVAPPTVVVVARHEVGFSDDDGASVVPWNDGVGPARLKAVAALDDGSFALASEAGLLLAAGLGSPWQDGGLGAGEVTALLAVGDRLVVATLDGLLVREPTGALTGMPGLPGIEVLSLALDVNGELLVGTDGDGLFRAPLP